jgi:hypothetical protein
MKVAIAFWGLPRSVKYTINSIQTNIFDVLTRENIEYDIYIHAYILNGKYQNVRTKENCEQIDNEQYKLLNPKYLKLDDQNIVKQKLNLPQYYSKKDPWNTGYNSVNNYILSSYSKLIVSEMIKQNDNTYDYILYMRPDVLYLNELPVSYLDETHCNNTQICVPDFHSYGFYKNMKINDRFAICNRTTYKIYGYIFLYLLNLSKITSLHSESILTIILSQNKIKWEKIPFYFNRVRVNGVVLKDN